MSLKEKNKEYFAEEWWRLLGNQFETEKMQDIYSKVKEIAKQEKVLPTPDMIYNSFKKCDYRDVLVCFVIGEPIIDYSKSKLWQNMSRWIENECFDGLNLNLEDNLDYMLEQGVFNLPIVLTRSKNISHNQVGWQFFTKEVIKHLNNSLNKICFVYEDSCMEFMDGISVNYHKIIKLEEGCFKQINEFMSKEYNTKLDWTSR